MARNIRKSKMKKMRPIFFVFCEGKTEVSYVNFLKAKYRLPIEIIPKKSESNISVQYIENCKRDYFTTASDRTFLMYDLDIKGLYNKLSLIDNVTLIVSNPCVEYWYLLHCKVCCTEINTNDCIKKYESISRNYKKGFLNLYDMNLLNSGEDMAIERAKETQCPGNPSTTVYKLVEALREYLK